MEDETAATTALFNSFNFYADFLIATLKERFAPITQEPIAYFSILITITGLSQLALQLSIATGHRSP